MAAVGDINIRLRKLAKELPEGVDLAISVEKFDGADEALFKVDAWEVDTGKLILTCGPYDTIETCLDEAGY